MGFVWPRHGSRRPVRHSRAVDEPHGSAPDGWQSQVQQLLDMAGVRLQGDAPWDIRLHRPRALQRMLAKGNLGLGESYMDGDWDCEQLDELISRLLRARLDKQVRTPAMLGTWLRARWLNLQTPERAWQVAHEHYDLDNDLFARMLDPTMAYSCGYWAHARNLEEAQRDKLELICRKLQLKPGMRLLDIGCGWGSLMRHAAEHHGVHCVGLTVSQQQSLHGREKSKGLPIRFQVTDYRSFSPESAQRFDRVASVGMFEHVGPKNHHDFFAMARRCLHDDGLLLLHTIGRRADDSGIDPWIEKYIFPNGVLPSAAEIEQASSALFVLEDLHNFGADYDRTLMAWHARFEAAWPELSTRYNARFRRMWRYYLLSCAGSFRARANQLWQWVLSPQGMPGGYRRPPM